MSLRDLIVLGVFGFVGTVLSFACWTGRYRRWVGTGWEYRYLIMLPFGLMLLSICFAVSIEGWAADAAFGLALVCGLSGMVLFVLLNTPWRYRFYPRWYKREYGRR
jgi:hypothetical protein